MSVPVTTASRLDSLLTSSDSLLSELRASALACAAPAEEGVPSSSASLRESVGAALAAFASIGSGALRLQQPELRYALSSRRIVGAPGLARLPSYRAHAVESGLAGCAAGGGGSGASLPPLSAPATPLRPVVANNTPVGVRSPLSAAVSAATPRSSAPGSPPRSPQLRSPPRSPRSAATSLGSRALAALAAHPPPSVFVPALAALPIATLAHRGGVLPAAGGLDAAALDRACVVRRSGTAAAALAAALQAAGVHAGVKPRATSAAVVSTLPFISPSTGFGAAVVGASGAVYASGAALSVASGGAGGGTGGDAVGDTVGDAVSDAGSGAGACSGGLADAPLLAALGDAIAVGGESAVELIVLVCVAPVFPDAPAAARLLAPGASAASRCASVVGDAPLLVGAFLCGRGSGGRGEMPLAAFLGSTYGVCPPALRLGSGEVPLAPAAPEATAQAEAVRDCAWEGVVARYRTGRGDDGRGDDRGLVQRLGDAYAAHATPVPLEFTAAAAPRRYAGDAHRAGAASGGVVADGSARAAAAAATLGHLDTHVPPRSLALVLWEAMGRRDPRGAAAAAAGDGASAEPGVPLWLRSATWAWLDRRADAAALAARGSALTSGGSGGRLDSLRGGARAHSAGAGGSGGSSAAAPPPLRWGEVQDAFIAICMGGASPAWEQFAAPPAEAEGAAENSVPPSPVPSAPFTPHAALPPALPLLSSADGRGLLGRRGITAALGAAPIVAGVTHTLVGGSVAALPRSQRRSLSPGGRAALTRSHRPPRAVLALGKSPLDAAAMVVAAETRRREATAAVAAAAVPPVAPPAPLLASASEQSLAALSPAVQRFLTHPGPFDAGADDAAQPRDAVLAPLPPPSAALVDTLPLLEHLAGLHPATRAALHPQQTLRLWHCFVDAARGAAPLVVSDASGAAAAALPRQHPVLTARAQAPPASAAACAAAYATALGSLRLDAPALLALCARLGYASLPPLPPAAASWPAHASLRTPQPPVLLDELAGEAAAFVEQRGGTLAFGDACDFVVSELTAGGDAHAAAHARALRAEAVWSAQAGVAASARAHAAATDALRSTLGLGPTPPSVPLAGVGAGGYATVPVVDARTGLVVSVAPFASDGVGGFDDMPLRGFRDGAACAVAVHMVDGWLGAPGSDPWYARGSGPLLDYEVYATRVLLAQPSIVPADVPAPAPVPPPAPASVSSLPPSSARAAAARMAAASAIQPLSAAAGPDAPQPSAPAPQALEASSAPSVAPAAAELPALTDTAPLAVAAAAVDESTPYFSLGARVFARFRGGSKAFPGTITGAQLAPRGVGGATPRALYTVAYDDGDIERDVPAKFVRATAPGVARPAPHVAESTERANSISAATGTASLSVSGAATPAEALQTESVAPELAASSVPAVAGTPVLVATTEAPAIAAAVEAAAAPCFPAPVSGLVTSAVPVQLSEAPAAVSPSVGAAEANRAALPAPVTSCLSEAALSGPISVTTAGAPAESNTGGDGTAPHAASAPALVAAAEPFAVDPEPSPPTPRDTSGAVASAIASVPDVVAPSESSSVSASLAPASAAPLSQGVAGASGGSTAADAVATVASTAAAPLPLELTALPLAVQRPESKDADNEDPHGVAAPESASVNVSFSDVDSVFPHGARSSSVPHHRRASTSLTSALRKSNE